VSRSVGQVEPRGKARTTEPAERGARVVWRARGVAAPPAAPTRRRSSRGGVDAERFGSRGNQRERSLRSHLPSSSGRAPPRRSIRRTSSPPSKRSGRSWPRRFGEARSEGTRCG
jgi:hypothetical protein